MENPDALVHLSVSLLEDLKAAREQLDQNPNNSSRPPSSRDPWFRNSCDDDVDPDEEIEADISGEAATSKAEESSEEDVSSSESKKSKKSSSQQKNTSRSPGKQKGAKGVGRTQKLSIDHVVHHRPQSCDLCAAGLPHEGAVCYTAFQTVDVVLGTETKMGLGIETTEYRYYDLACKQCGHITREEPHRAPPQQQVWGNVELTEWRLIGPTLAALLSMLHYRWRLSARHCRELFIELFGLHLSVGAIQQSFHESARGSEPVMESLASELAKQEVTYADETPHKQAGVPLWLWVAMGASTVLFFIGRRTKETFWGGIGIDLAGWLMSDGYRVYREYELRLRCWAHLIRKARGLAETYTPHVQGYGRTILEILDTLKQGVYNAREGPPSDLVKTFTADLSRLKALCIKMSNSKNEKARKLGVEFLNDWDAIFRVLEHPHLPLTNNLAERILRHWVILRRITQGTRTTQGSRALAIMASIIESCRLRNASPLRYLAQVIAAGRQGLDVPPLPSIPAAA